MAKACSYVDCYVPDEWHNKCAAAPVSECWGKLEHQHTPKRSQGGKECYVMLCSAHHDALDNGTKYKGKRLMNDILSIDSVRYYRIWERGKGAALVKIPILSGSDETGDDQPPLLGQPSSDPPGFGAWVQQLATLRNQRIRSPYLEGWALAEGELRFGEMAAEGWDQLRLSEVQISQRIRVAHAFPPSWIEAHDPDGVLPWGVARRLSSASWGEDERFFWAHKCIEGQWTESAFCDALREAGLLPERQRIRSYRLAELRELGVEYLREHDTDYEPDIFLDWLEERENV